VSPLVAGFCTVVAFGYEIRDVRLSLLFKLIRPYIGCVSDDSVEPGVEDPRKVASVVVSIGRLLAIDLVEQLWRRVFTEDEVRVVGTDVVRRDVVGSVKVCEVRGDKLHKIARHIARKRQVRSWWLPEMWILTRFPMSGKCRSRARC
jgi:hypothetical protein